MVNFRAECCGFMDYVLFFSNVTFCGTFLQIISPYNLYLNPTLVVKQYQFWRLVTNFLYFRKMGNLS